MESSKTTNKGQVVIPKKFRKKFGIKPGTKVAFAEKNGELVIRVMDRKYFEKFAGILKGGGDVLGELVKEKAREREL